MEEKSAALRLFVAIDLPDSLQEQLRTRCSERNDLSWSPVERLHLTLAFIGNTLPSKVSELDTALKGVQFTPFQLQIDHLGSFRHGLIWLGAAPHPQLEALHSDICTTIQSVVPYTPAHSFIPHITLARGKREASPVMLEQLQSSLLHTGLTLDVDQFCLKNSVLTPSGALHQVLALYDARALSAVPC